MPSAAEKQANREADPQLRVLLTANGTVVVNSVLYDAQSEIATLVRSVFWPIVAQAASMDSGRPIPEPPVLSWALKERSRETGTVTFESVGRDKFCQ